MSLTLNDFSTHQLSLYILSSDWNGPHWPAHALGHDVAWMNADDPKNRRFAFVLNAANGAVYSGGGVSLGIGMPWWVMVDCALMPAGFFGVRGPAKLLAPEKRKLINEILKEIPMPLGVNDASLTAPLHDDEIIPLAEASTLACAMPDKISSYSLYSLVPGLAVVAKSLSLSAYRQLGRSLQMGIAQYDNKSLRIHTQFGPLEIMNFAVPLHTLSEKTFYYRLEIPSEQTLAALSRGETITSAITGTPEMVAVDDVKRHAEFERRRLAGTHRYYVVAPGLTGDKKYNPILEVENT